MTGTDWRERSQAREVRLAGAVRVYRVLRGRPGKPGNCAGTLARLSRLVQRTTPVGPWSQSVHRAG